MSVNSVNQPDLLPGLPIVQALLQSAPVIQPHALGLRRVDVLDLKRATEFLLRLLYPLTVVDFEGIDLFLVVRLLDRLLCLHDLHQRGLIRHAPVRRVVFTRDVDIVGVR